MHLKKDNRGRLATDPAYVGKGPSSNEKTFPRPAIPVPLFSRARAIIPPLGIQIKSTSTSTLLNPISLSYRLARHLNEQFAASVRTTLLYPSAFYHSTLVPRLSFFCDSRVVEDLLFGWTGDL